MSTVNGTKAQWPALPQVVRVRALPRVVRLRGGVPLVAQVRQLPPGAGKHG